MRASDLWGLEPGEERSALCWYKRWEGDVSPWDGRRPSEPTEDTLARHEKARLICRRCPLITACERALSDLERQALRVDGVMAGRYSDVHPGVAGGESAFCQRVCRGCQVPLIPQGTIHPRTKIPADARPHLGEGLCEDCYPWLALATGKQPPTPPRPHHVNNPLGQVVGSPPRPGPRTRREGG